MMKVTKRLLQVAIVVLLFVGQASATSILVSVSGGTAGYGYGFADWTNFTNALDTASGSGVVTTSDFTDLSQMLTFDALMLDQRWTSGTLGASEAVNLAAYIATGRRVLMIGENDSWSSWNNQILAIVGSSYGGGVDGISNSVLAHELTAGAPVVDLPTSGAAVGGTALYDQNFATLWGASQNVLTVLDVNVFADSYAASFGNGVFTTNVANWLASAPGNPPVPEPATMTLLGLGLVGLVARSRKNNA